MTPPVEQKGDPDPHKGQFKGDPREKGEISPAGDKTDQFLGLETLFEEVILTSPIQTSSPETIPKEVTTELGPHGSSKSCFYVPGKIGRIRGSFLIDTGSSILVLSNKVLAMHSSDLQTVQEKVVTANGQELKLLGKLKLNIQLEHLDFSQVFIVADIDEDFGNLGMDFLQDYKASIKIGKRVLKTSAGKLKLFRQSSRVCAGLRLEGMIDIPPHSEVFVKGYIDRTFPGTREPLECWNLMGGLCHREC